MDIIREESKMPPCALCLGNFDGLHPAHKKIILNGVKYAQENNILCGVLLFENHTDNVCKRDSVRLLTTMEEKLEIIRALGADFVFIKKFDLEFMKRSYEEFFFYVKRELKARALFAGFDYTFGYQKKGTSEILEKMGREQNVFVNICTEQRVENVTYSSSHIRELVKKGDMEETRKNLGYLYSVSGKVVSGKQNGRKMGLPTANIAYDKQKLLPGDGVYFCKTQIEGKEYKSLVNVGKNPTFNGEERTVESFLLDFSGDLYNRYATICFIKKIRDEKKFSSPEELKKQITADLQEVRKEMM